MAAAHLKLLYNGQRKTLVAAVGLEAKGVGALIQAAYGLSNAVVALADAENDLIIPLETVLLSPALFRGPTYGLVVKGRGVMPLEPNFIKRKAAPKHYYADGKQQQQQQQYPQQQRTYQPSSLDRKEHDATDDAVKRIIDLQQKLGLNEAPMQTVLSILAYSKTGTRTIGEEERVDPSRLNKAFLEFLPAMSSECKSLCQRVVSEITHIFDQDNDGLLDLKELTAAMSILWGGTEKDKVFLIFKSLDHQGLGVISTDEMEEYLTAFFKACFHFSGLSLSKQYSAEMLAVTMARQCSEDVDRRNEGTISFQDFTRWYSSSDAPISSSMGAAAAAAAPAAGDGGARGAGDYYYSSNKYEGGMGVGGMGMEMGMGMETTLVEDSSDGEESLHVIVDPSLGMSEEASGLRPATRRSDPNPKGPLS